MGCLVAIASTVPTVTFADKARRERRADDAGTPIAVEGECERVAAPGRVKCDVRVRSSAGKIIRWADVSVVRAPESVLPLRARIGPREATGHRDDLWQFSLGLVAKEK